MNKELSIKLKELRRQSETVHANTMKLLDMLTALAEKAELTFSEPGDKAELTFSDPGDKDEKKYEAPYCDQCEARHKEENEAAAAWNNTALRLARNSQPLMHGLK